MHTIINPKIYSLCFIVKCHCNSSIQPSTFFNCFYPVLPQRPKCISSRFPSATLSWEQLYDCDEEKASKYHIEVANKPELSRIIDHTFGDTSPSLCAHTLSGLQPGRTYRVVIIAGNESGTVHSDEVTITTQCKSFILISLHHVIT